MLSHDIMIKDCSSNQFRQVLSPHDLQVIGQVALADSTTCLKALENAHRLFQTPGLQIGKPERKAILERTAQLMQTQFDELVSIAASEGGKPLKDTQIEVARAIDGIQNCAECIRNTAGREIPMEVNTTSAHKIAWTSHEPIGVVLAISAFNHPLNLIVHQIGPAIAAGCPVIIKPAEDTPLSCFKLVQLLREAGLPTDYCQPLLPIDHNALTPLITSERLGFFSFIGSAKVGWMLQKKLAPGVRCALEHGGAAPLIIAEDADLDKALPSITKGGFYHAGQVCVSVQRVFVAEKLIKTVSQELIRLAQALKIGDPLDPNTEVGPLIRPTEIQRVHQWVQQDIDQGAKLLLGGEPINDTYYQPTLLLNPGQQANLSQKEIFGPVMGLYPFTDITTAITQANAVPFSFQASIMTQSLDTTLKAYRELNASAVIVNDHTAFRVDWMPFSGLKTSGYGIGGIPYTFEDMQIEKMLVLHSTSL